MFKPFLQITNHLNTLSGKTVKMKKFQKIVAYYQGASVFKLPEGIKLEDTTKVKDWWVRWNTLHVEFVDGTITEFEPVFQDDGHKTPSDVFMTDSDTDD